MNHQSLWPSHAAPDQCFLTEALQNSLQTNCAHGGEGVFTATFLALAAQTHALKQPMCL